MNKFFKDSFLDLDLNDIPEEFQPIFEKILAREAKFVPELATAMMAWVWKSETPNIPERYFEETRGIAEGLCAARKPRPCNVDFWTEKIRALNMLPELVRMACTVFGAWGDATPKDAGLLQLRALDFGTGPWAKYTVIQVHHDDNAPMNSFVSVSFPAFVGVITGVSEHGIGVSEKVMMVHGDKSIPPGNYKGEPDVFVLRDILEFSKNRQEAEDYVQTIPRTWAIWIGVGDYESQKLDVIGYRQENATTYNDVTMPQKTEQPYIKDVIYVDKHPQPSTGDFTLSEALNDFYGDITSETTKSIVQYHRTGDVHYATYDFFAKEMTLAIGRVNENFAYCPDEACPDSSVWKAYNRPAVKFNLEDLFSRK